MDHTRDEPVRMERKRFAYLPEAFIWRGRCYDVRRVERSWTVTRGAGERRIERRYFRVHCDQGTFDLYHDILANVWHVSAARSYRLPAFSAQRMAQGRSLAAGWETKTEGNGRVRGRGNVAR